MRYPALYGHFKKTAAIPPSEWLWLEPVFKRQRLSKGEFLLKAGEPVGGFAVLLSGLVRIYYIDPDGVETTKSFEVAHGLAAAYAELLSALPSRTYIQALEDTDILVARHQDFTRLYKRHACWQEIGRKIAERQFLAKEEREFQFLQLSATERYLKFRESFPLLKGRLSQGHIASYLGITAVALSRIIGKLKGR